MTLSRNQWCALAAAVAAVAGGLFWPGPLKRLVAAGPPTEAASTADRPEIADSSSPGQPPNSPNATSPSDAAHPPAVVSPEEEALVNECLARVTKTFQSIEHGDFEVVGKKKPDVNGYVTTYVMIKEPSGDTYSKYSQALSAALKDLPENARRWSYPRQLQLLRAYTDFPYPYKLVSHRINNERPDPARTERYIEQFVQTRESFTIEDEKSAVAGKMRCRQLAPEEANRYRHLFEE